MLEKGDNCSTIHYFKEFKEYKAGITKVPNKKAVSDYPYVIVPSILRSQCLMRKIITTILIPILGCTRKKYLSKPLTLLELILLTIPNINNIADKSNSQHLMLLNQVFIGVYTTLRLYKYS